jgi:hypothetical protein
MPPQPPSGKWGGTLYELLRPELVRLSAVPLSPDAFSNMGHPEDAKECRQAVRDIFLTLTRPQTGGIIFDYAQLIDSKEETQSEISERSVNLTAVHDTLAAQEVLVRELHSRGINMRFLGTLRSFCTAPNMRLFLLAECFARFWKCELRHLWRDVMRHETTPSAEPFRKVTSRYLNTLIKDASYWKQLKTNLPVKFPSVLSVEESAEDYPLREFFAPAYQAALVRLLECLNIELERGTLTALLDACSKGLQALSAFEFVSGDILHMSCRTKHMSTVDKADAYAYMYQAAALSKTNAGTASRLLSMALGKLLTAMKTAGTDLELQFKFCQCRVESFKLNADSEALSLAQDALSALKKKLELMGSPILPNVLLLSARLQMVKLKRITDPSAAERFQPLELALVALKSYKVWRKMVFFWFLNFGEIGRNI